MIRTFVKAVFRSLDSPRLTVILIALVLGTLLPMLSHARFEPLSQLYQSTVGPMIGLLIEAWNDPDINSQPSAPPQGAGGQRATGSQPDHSGPDVEHGSAEFVRVPSAAAPSQYFRPDQSSSFARVADAIGGRLTVLSSRTANRSAHETEETATKLDPDHLFRYPAHWPRLKPQDYYPKPIEQEPLEHYVDRVMETLGDSPLNSAEFLDMAQARHEARRRFLAKAGKRGADQNQQDASGLESTLPNQYKRLDSRAYKVVLFVPGLSKVGLNPNNEDADLLDPRVARKSFAAIEGLIKNNFTHDHAWFDPNDEQTILTGNHLSLGHNEVRIGRSGEGGTLIVEIVNGSIPVVDRRGGGGTLPMLDWDFATFENGIELKAESIEKLKAEHGDWNDRGFFIDYGRVGVAKHRNGPFVEFPCVGKQKVPINNGCAGLVPPQGGGNRYQLSAIYDRLSAADIDSVRYIRIRDHGVNMKEAHEGAEGHDVFGISLINAFEEQQ